MHQYLRFLNEPNLCEKKELQSSVSRWLISRKKKMNSTFILSVYLRLQAITRLELQFFDVIASWPGSVHVSRIFNNCQAKVLYGEVLMTGLLLGDMGYACTPYLMTPLADPGTAGSPDDK